MDATGRDAISKYRWLSPLAFVLVGFLLLLIDVPIAASFHGDRSRSLSDFLQTCEAFGHGYGATLILIAVVVLDPLKLRDLPWLIAGSLGSGLAANLLKLLIPRTRPRDFELATRSVWETFVRGPGDLKSMQSMPSAHTATAVGLAIMLTAIYPRGRYLFGTLALLVGIQRIATQAHFPSDVCGGAVVGCVVGIICATIVRGSSRPERTRES